MRSAATSSQQASGSKRHALRLCGAILAFCAVFAPAARPTLLEGLGRGGVGELANCISDLAAAVHEEGSEGGDGAAAARAATLRVWAGAVAAVAPS